MITRKTLGFATASLLLASTSVLADDHGGVKVYGSAHIQLDMITKKVGGEDDKANSGHQLQNDSSKFGFKGSKELDNGMQGLYQIEIGNAIDAESTSLRNSFVGLKGGFGSIKVGKHDTALKTSRPRDVFSGSNHHSWLSVPVAAVSGAGGFLGRWDNTIRYDGGFGPVAVALSLAPNEGSAKTTDGATATSSITDNTSVSLAYGSKKSGIYAAFGAETRGGKEKGNNRSNTLISLQWAGSGIVASLASAGSVTDGDGAKASSVNQVKLAYDLGALTPVLAFSSGTNGESENKAITYSGLSLGANYNLGGGTTTYFEYHSTTKTGDGSDKDAKNEDTNIVLGLAVGF